MKNPFRTLLKASRLARKAPVSAAIALQRALLSAVAKPKRGKPGPAPAKRRAPLKKRVAVRPQPGSFVDGQFSNAHGRLAYKLYTPRGSSRRKLPLVVMLHGCTQTAADFALGTGMNTIADELGFLVLYPQQSVAANLGRCWNWHRPGDQKRDAGEPALIAGLTRQILATCKANPARVYIAGISAGGAAAAIIASAYPDLYVAAGVHSGVAQGDITTLRGAVSAMRTGIAADASCPAERPPPTIVFHGDQDNVVHPANAAGFLSQLRRSGANAVTGKPTTGRSIGGRGFTRTATTDSAGRVLLEDWVVHGSGHAWSGGNAAGSHTDPAGPDASREMLRFFLERRRAVAAAATRAAGKR